TTARDLPVDIVFGSCRTAYPHEEPYTLRKDEHDDGREVCGLRALALRLRTLPPESWPGALLLLGDQIYADETEPDTQRFIERRRDPEVPPGRQVGDFREYVHAYNVSWRQPPIRWLLSTVATAMIFDDHDVIDDWNTSLSWLEMIRAQGWWDERIVGAFVSYWIFQHLGNLSPQALETDDLWQQVQQADDAGQILRDFAFRADRAVDSTQWSYCRDIGSARLVMVDSRAGRVLEPGKRTMVDEDEWAFIEESATSQQHDHLLIGSSLPWLMAPGMHHLEAWNEAISEGAWGKPGARVGEKLRQALDLEHWPAFNDSFRRLTRLIGRIGAGEDGEPPATIVALGGDVHHAYLAEVAYPAGANVRSRVYQAVCSPFRNPLDTRERRVIRGISSMPAARLTRALARRAGVEDPEITWKLRQRAVFDNVVATLHLNGRSASLTIERARPLGGGDLTLETAFEGTL
ncbi:MAG: hypothetical protein QOE86_3781, partial [Solirubrobacteraceae bacterium]|nr:hypothetical protein [Solirubrobacteraceae bacterium]